MIRHYLASALRSFRRRPVSAAIKLLALSLGLACLLTAHAIGDHFRQPDRHWSKADRIYALNQFQALPGGDWEGSVIAGAGPAAAQALKLDVPELEAVARLRPAGGRIEANGEMRQFPLAAVDADFLQIFDLDMVAGRAAFGGPESVLLSADVARQLFGGAGAAVGQTVTLNGAAAATVSGVFAEPPDESHLGLAMAMPLRVVVPMGLFDEMMFGGLPPNAIVPGRPESGEWSPSLYLTYALLPGDGSLSAAQLRERLPGFAERRVPGGQAQIRFELLPVSAIAQARFDARFGRLDMSVTTILYLFGGLILAMACIDFANLAAAEAAGRTQEIGLRKTLGAARGQIALQTLTETAILAGAAVLIVAPLTGALLAPLGARFDLELSPPGLGRIDYWASVLAIVAGVVVLAGGYPALVLAGLRPAFALRASGLRGGSGPVRAVMIGAQFAASAVLIVLLAVMLAQSGSLRRMVAQPGEDVLVSAALPQMAAQDQGEALLRELTAHPSVTAATLRNQTPYAQSLQDGRLWSASPDPNSGVIVAQDRSAYYGYFSVMGTELLAGREFEAGRDNPVGGGGGLYPFVINREAAAALGLTPEEAVGHRLYFVSSVDEESGQIEVASGNLRPTIIGVVEHEPLEIVPRGPGAYLYALNAFGNFAVMRVARGGLQDGLDHVRDVLAERYPGQEAEIAFLADAFDERYRSFAMLNVVMLSLAALGAAIAAMGLFGMAGFVVRRRIREMGVRKTLGASSRRVLAMMLWDFAKPVVAANLVAWPFAVIAARAYLNQFATRIELTPAPFLAALVFTLLVAALAVIGQTWRAASVTPANVLKHE